MPERHTLSVDGDDLAAVHHPSDGDRWLVFCHGFRSDKSGSYEERCERAVAEGYDAVRFDFRGCGESDRAFVETTLSTRIADLRAVVEHFDPSSYALFGSSFGGKTAFHAADDDRLEAIVTRAPVTYDRPFEPARQVVEETGAYRYDDDHVIDERFFADFDRYDFEDAASTVDVPVAVFHGREDATVPLSDSLDAAGALDTDVTLWALRGERHRFSPAAEERLRDAAFEWLADVQGTE